MGLIEKVKGEFRRMAHTEEEIEEDFDGLEAPRYERKERSERVERNDRLERTDRRSREMTTADWEKDRSRNRVQEVENRSRLRNRVSKAGSIVELQTSSLQQVVVINPKDSSEARSIADYLCSKNTILLNMESTDKEEAKRILDFLAGVAYANDGKVTMVNDKFYLVTPFTTNVISELLDGLENHGIFYET